MTRWWETERGKPDGGWCGGWQRDPHYADALVPSSTPVLLCLACWSSSNRDGHGV